MLIQCLENRRSWALAEREREREREEEAGSMGETGRARSLRVLQTLPNFVHFIVRATEDHWIRSVADQICLKNYPLITMRRHTKLECGTSHFTNWPIFSRNSTSQQKV